MCQKCVDFAGSLFGEMSNEELNKLFWGATSFPAGSHEQVRKQLQDHYDNGAKTVNEAVSRAHESMAS